jgi:hypothetical protein
MQSKDAPFSGCFSLANLLKLRFESPSKVTFTLG